MNTSALAAHAILHCLNHLVERFESSGHRTDEIMDSDAPIRWNEWSALIHRVNELRLVGPYIGGTPESSLLVQQVTELPTSVEDLDFEQIHQVIYFLVRSEKWGDLDPCTGGGPLWDALRSGTLRAIACRLETIGT